MVFGFFFQPPEQRQMVSRKSQLGVKKFQTSARLQRWFARSQCYQCVSETVLSLAILAQSRPGCKTDCWGWLFSVTC